MWKVRLSSSSSKAPPHVEVLSKRRPALAFVGSSRSCPQSSPAHAASHAQAPATQTPLSWQSVGEAQPDAAAAAEMAKAKAASAGASRARGREARTEAILRTGDTLAAEGGLTSCNHFPTRLAEGG
jgi:hypothetical protein